MHFENKTSINYISAVARRLLPYFILSHLLSREKESSYNDVELFVTTEFAFVVITCNATLRILLADTRSLR